MSTNKLGMRVHACNPSYMRGIGRRFAASGCPQAVKGVRPYLKITKAKRAGS
jgi:hypothetical protein